MIETMQSRTNTLGKVRISQPTTDTERKLLDTLQHCVKVLGFELEERPESIGSPDRTKRLVAAIRYANRTVIETTLALPLPITSQRPPSHEGTWEMRQRWRLAKLWKLVRV